MANAADDHGRATTPSDIAVTTPISGDAVYARLRIEAVEEGVGEIKDDIREIRAHRHSDFVHILEIFGTGFLVLAGMLVAAYFIVDSKFDKADSKVDRIIKEQTEKADRLFKESSERVEKLSNSATRIDAKLEDLLARIPPVPSPVPQRSPNPAK